MRSLAIAFAATALAASPAPAGGDMTDAATPHLKRLDGAASPAATLEEVSWIAGAWQGSAFGGVIEEIWWPARGGAMMGMFRAATEDAVRFYELMSISEEGASLVLRIKHFNPDLTGWEEKDESMVFPLVAVDADHAYFDGLTFERAAREGGASGLTIYVRHEEEDGSERELVFEYEAQSGGPGPSK